MTEIGFSPELGAVCSTPVPSSDNLTPHPGAWESHRGHRFPSLGHGVGPEQPAPGPLQPVCAKPGAAVLPRGTDRPALSPFTGVSMKRSWLRGKLGRHRIQFFPVLRPELALSRLSTPRTKIHPTGSLIPVPPCPESPLYPRIPNPCCTPMP